MRITSIAILMDFLFIIPFMFASSGNYPMEWKGLMASGILAFVAIAFRWYNNIGFEDRFLCALQVLAIAIACNLFFPSFLSLDRIAEHFSIPVEALYIILFYVILIIIGTYTTFYTRTGFLGVADEKHIVRRNSLVLLSCIIAITFGIIFLPDFIIGWFIMTGILWRSNVWFWTRTNHTGYTKKIE